MEKFEVPQLLETQLSKVEHPQSGAVYLIFLVSVLAITIMGGLALFCMYKGGNLVWAVKINPATFKIECKIHK